MSISSLASSTRPVLILAGILIACFVGLAHLQYSPGGPISRTVSPHKYQILAKDGYQYNTLYSTGAVQEPDREDERPVNVDHLTMLSVMLFGTILALSFGIGMFRRRGFTSASFLRLHSPLFIYAGSRRPAPTLLEIFRL